MGSINLDWSAVNDKYQDKLKEELISKKISIQGFCDAMSEFRNLSQEILKMAVDKELLTIQRVLKNLEPLTLEEQYRVLNYVTNRLQEKRLVANPNIVKPQFDASPVKMTEWPAQSAAKGESHNG